MSYPTSDPRTVATETGAKIAGQADRHQSTGATHDTVAYAVRLSCIVRGCTCSPTVAEVTAGRLTYLQVVHVHGCPAIAEEVGV